MAASDLRSKQEILNTYYTLIYLARGFGNEDFRKSFEDGYTLVNILNPKQRVFRSNNLFFNKVSLRDCTTLLAKVDPVRFSYLSRQEQLSYADFKRALISFSESKSFTEVEAAYKANEVRWDIASEEQTKPAQVKKAPEVAAPVSETVKTEEPSKAQIIKKAAERAPNLVEQHQPHPVSKIKAPEKELEEAEESVQVIQEKGKVVIPPLIPPIALKKEAGKTVLETATGQGQAPVITSIPSISAGSRLKATKSFFGRATRVTGGRVRQGITAISAPLSSPVKNLASSTKILLGRNASRALPQIWKAVGGVGIGAMNLLGGVSGLDDGDGGGGSGRSGGRSGRGKSPWESPSSRNRREEAERARSVATKRKLIWTLLVIMLILFILGAFNGLFNLPEDPATQNEDVKIVKSSSRSEVANGEEIVYNLAVTYTGGGQADISITEPIPQGTEFLSASGEPSNSPVPGSVSVIWNLRGMNSQEVRTVTFTVLPQKENFWVINEALYNILNVTGQTSGGTISPGGGMPIDPSTIAADADFNTLMEGQGRNTNVLGNEDSFVATIIKNGAKYDLASKEAFIRQIYQAAISKNVNPLVVMTTWGTEAFFKFAGERVGNVTIRWEMGCDPYGGKFPGFNEQLQCSVNTWNNLMGEFKKRDEDGDGTVRLPSQIGKECVYTDEFIFATERYGPVCVVWDANDHHRKNFATFYKQLIGVQ